MFRLFNKKEKIYCQKGGEEIVRNKENKGAYVSNDGRVFCLNENMSSFYVASMKNAFSMDYRSYSELQEDIREGKLTHFGKLKKLEDVLK